MSVAASSSPDKGKAPALRTKVDNDDDDDDDIDDLDDVIQQFKGGALQGKASSDVTASTQSAYDRLQSNSLAGTSRAAAKASRDVKASDDTDKQDDVGDEEDDDEDFEAVFANELAKEMEKMMSGLKPSSDNVDLPGRGDNDLPDKHDETEEERQFREAFEKILSNASEAEGNGESGDGEDINFEELGKLMKGLAAGGLASDAPLSSASSSSAAKGKSKSTAKQQPSSQQPQSFQDTINATMSRMAASEAAHKERDSASTSGGKDPLAALMAQMVALGGPGGLAGQTGDDAEDLPELLDGLMDQLMSKELLYEPITELKAKYPEYLTSGEAASLPVEERRRYEKQGDIVRKIANIFDDPKYSDSNKEMRDKISDLMQQMQNLGAPPKHLLGELGPALALNPDGTPNVDPEFCVIS